jgi:hypothetical protein
VGKEGVWIIMKKQVPQDVVQSTYILRIGGKIPKWWGGGYSRGDVHFISLLEASARGKKKGT